MSRWQMPEVSARMRKESLLLVVIQAEKAAKVLAVQNSFESIAIEWHNHKKENWSQGYAEDILEYLTKDIFPFIGKRAINEIKPAEMLAVLRKMEQRGVLDKLKKTRQDAKLYHTVTEFEP